MGPSMVCVHERDESAAKAAARFLAKRFFDARHDFRFSVDAYEPGEALERASVERERPVIVTDSGDNTTAGSAGDNAYLLKLLREKAITGALIGGLTDEPAVRKCHVASLGDLLDLDLGGTIEPTSTRTSFRGTLLFRPLPNIFTGPAVVLLRHAGERLTGTYVRAGRTEVDFTAGRLQGWASM